MRHKKPVNCHTDYSAPESTRLERRRRWPEISDFAVLSHLSMNRNATHDSVLHSRSRGTSRSSASRSLGSAKQPVKHLLQTYVCCTAYGPTLARILYYESLISRTGNKKDLLQYLKPFSF